MKKLLLLLLPIAFCFSQTVSAQVYQWAKDAGGVLDDEIFDMTHDASGNIYVTGIFEGTADLDPGTGTANFTAVGAGDMFFAKYDPSGNLLWAKGVGSVGDEEGQGIRLDPSGNIYLTGLYSDVADFDPGIGIANLTSNGGFDIYIAKYDNDGNYLWAKSIGNSGNFDDYPSKLAVDISGNLYVTGQFSSTADFDAGAGTANLVSTGGFDVFFMKYDTNGNYVWAKSISNSSNADDFGNNITLDNNNNVYITGQFDGTCDFDPSASTANLTAVGGLDIFFAKYDNNGNYTWAKSIGSTTDDSGCSIITDITGNVFIAGLFTGTADFNTGAGTANLISAGLDDIYYGKYDSNGDYLWAQSLGGTSNDQANAITLDDSGNLLLTGQFTFTTDFDPGVGTVNLVSAGSWDIFFAKYATDGSFIWAVKVGGSGSDQSHVIDYISAGNFVIAGEFPNSADFDPSTGTASLSSFGLDDIFFAKYNETTLGIEENSMLSSDALIYPNPASEKIIVQVKEKGELKIFNEIGTEVAQSKLIVGSNCIDISSLSTGIYFLTIQSDKQSFSKKIIMK